MHRTISVLLGIVELGAVAGTADAQTTLDRVDPAKIEAAKPLPAERAPAVSLPAAPSAAAAPVSGAAPITVGAVSLAGLRALKPSDFADILETYVGRTLSPAALAGLADAVADRARSRGYIFAVAAIPRQTLAAGVLTVQVDEGHIDQVRIVGNGNPAAVRSLTPLVHPMPVTRAEVERRLLVTADIDGLVLGRSRLVREGGHNILEVEIGKDRISGTAGLDNLGSRPIGPIQLDATVKVAQLLAADDSVTLGGVVTPAQPREFAYVRGRYAKRVDASGTEVSLNASFSDSHPGSYLRARDIDGRSWSLGAGVLRPLLRRRTASLWTEAAFGVRTVTQDFREQRVRRDRTTVARVGVYGYTAALGGYLRVNAGVSQGIDLFDSTQRGDPRASRADADGVFTLASLYADWSGPLAGPLSAQVAVLTQVASGPLLVGDEVGMGGGTFLRGYDYSERSGDRGAMGSAELRYRVVRRAGPLIEPTLFGFADGGRVTNFDHGIGGGTLFSTGGGVRAGLPKQFVAEAGVAVPLSGVRYDGGNSDPVVNFRLSKRF